MLSLQDYTLQEKIAEGRHSLIFRAKRKSDAASVMIKLLKEEAAFPKNVEKLTHEYALLKKMESEHVIQAYALIPVQNSFLLVEEDFLGVSLAKVIEEGDMDLLSALDAAIEMAEALGDIHHQNIIHKDIKPQNILLNRTTREVKVIDFGIAIELTRETQQAITPEQLEGSLSYISPEQTGRINCPVDYRSDIYSLGVTLYHLFAKELPFKAESPLELMHLHITRQPLPPAEIHPELPKTLSDVILKCMSKDPEQRYQSAFGLKKDLEKCRQQLLESGDISPFVPGQEDLYDHFHMPEKIYGREEELAFIANCLAETCNGEALLLALEGHEGVGKTSLVSEAQKRSRDRIGLFISMQVDLQKRLVPYSSLIQLLHLLLQQLLTESDESLKTWKERIQAAVGKNGKILTEVIPDLKLLLGEQPPIPSLAPRDNANRFNYVMLNFLKAFLLPERPLMIFVDDYQGVDIPSLKLLELFFSDPSVHHILFILGFREGEVEELHPLQLTLKEIASKGGKVEHLALKPLSLESFQQLIQEAFYGPRVQTEAVASLLYHKTQGNPSFALQLLKSLYEKELLYFNKEWGYWVANLREIEALPVSDNVADLLVEKLNNLKPEVLEILKTAAIIGMQFERHLLKELTGLSENQLVGLLASALQEELLMEIRGPQSTYRFIHDRVHREISARLTAQEKQRLHYSVGRYLFDHFSAEERQEEVLELVTHLNYGDKERMSPREKEELIRLNFEAGLKAKNAVAYDAAIQFFTKGIELLPADFWKEAYQKALRLHENLALCLSIIGGAKKAEPLFELCIQHAKTPFEKGELYAELIRLYSQLQDYQKCFETAVKALKLLGYSYDLHPSRLALKKAEFFLELKMRFRRVDFNTLPMATDENARLLSSILASLTYPAFVTGNQALFFRNAILLIDLALKYGVTKQTMIGMINYAMVLGSSQMKQYAKASRYGESGLKLSERFPHSYETAEALYGYYAFVHRWKHRLDTSIPPLKRNFRALLDLGGGSLAAADAIYISLIALVTGDKLRHVLATIDERLPEIKRFSSKSEEFSIRVLKQVCLCLNGMWMDPTDPMPPEFRDFQTKNQLNQLRYDVWHLVLCFLFGRFQEGLNIGKEILKKTGNYPNWIEWHIFYFFHALTLASQLTSPQDNPDHWKLLQEHARLLQEWAQASPFNYAHYEKLVRAEMLRIEGKKEQAEQAYEAALESAKESKYTQDIAIASELFAKFYQAQQLNERVSFFLQEAVEYYSHWGAEAKCMQLKNLIL